MAVVVGAATALLALGTALMLSTESPTTRPNVQTVGLVLALIGPEDLPLGPPPK